MPFLRTCLCLSLVGICLTGCWFGAEPQAEKSPIALPGKAVSATDVASIDVEHVEGTDVYTLVAEGIFPDNCSRIKESIQHTDATKKIITIALVTEQESNECGEEEVPFRHTFELDMGGLPEGIYTLKVNGAEIFFEKDDSPAPVAPTEDENAPPV